MYKMSCFKSEFTFKNKAPYIPGTVLTQPAKITEKADWHFILNADSSKNTHFIYERNLLLRPFLQ